MLTLVELNRDPCAVLLELRGYLTWTTGGVLKGACQAYRREGVNRIGLVVDQLWGVDLLALRALADIRASGIAIEVHCPGAFVRALLVSHGFGDWIRDGADAPAQGGGHVG